MFSGCECDGGIFETELSLGREDSNLRMAAVGQSAADAKLSADVLDAEWALAEHWPGRTGG
jgi:hypothetical protein